MAKTQSFVLCVKNRGAEDLQPLKVYRVLPDADAAKHDFIRVIDDSGEDYLYPAKYFLPIALPRGATRLFSKRSA
jgi:hypothetical protein